MRTILHIGQHKTGTTSIQHFMRDNQAMLIEQGFYYPKEVAGIENSSHFALNIYALSENRTTSIMDVLAANHGLDFLQGVIDTIHRELTNSLETIFDEAQKNRCHTVVFSNEGLFILNSVLEYKRLKSIFEPRSDEIEVVCCFRNLADYRRSYISELEFLKLPTVDDPDSYKYIQPDSFMFDYNRKKNLLEQVFDKCTYFDYVPEDNIKAFLEAIGYIGPPSQTSDFRRNQSRDDRTKL